MAEQQAVFGGDPCVTNRDEEGAEPFSASSLWREVPQARFLSWSRDEQFAYCAARDEDSTAFDPDYADFYLERAQRYKELLRAEHHPS